MRFDERQFSYAPGSPEQRAWVIRLLNTLLPFRAVELLIAADMFGAENGGGGSGSGGRERVQYAFARLNLGALSAIMLRTRAPAAGVLPQAMQREFEGMVGGKKGFEEMRASLVLFPLSTSTTTAAAVNNCFVVDLARMRRKRKALPPSTVTELSLLTAPDGGWLDGHALYIFRDNKHVLQCIASIQVYMPLLRLLVLLVV